MFLAVLTWCFYFIAALSALILTQFATLATRKYRKSIIAVCVSSFILGTLSGTSPYFMNKINPLQSTRVPIDSLVGTEWEEPVNNPETELSDNEIGWTKTLPYHFKFKLKPGETFKRPLAIEGAQLIYLDDAGSLRGFNAYTGLNHWHIPIKANQFLGLAKTEKRLYLLDTARLGQIRVSCFDSINPSLLWQRIIPSTKEGSLAFDGDSQSVLVASGNSGLWALKAKTGEVLWKRPALYSKLQTLSSPKHLVVFEPVIAGKPGSWYFLDSENGKFFKKIPHEIKDIQSFVLPDRDGPPPTGELAMLDPLNFVFLNLLDLSRFWTFHASEKIKIAKYVDADHYFLLYESGMLELRSLKNNLLIYQKKLAGVKTDWLRISPDLSLVTIPSSSKDETEGASFFNLNSGDYISTAKTSEPILDLQFFGDWMYLFSENYIWAFKK